MSYMKPYINAEGLHMSSYTEIRDYLMGEFKRIFGDDLYLSEDSQDYQMISIFSDALDDVSALCAFVYASRNPDYAIGHSLDLLLPLNGLMRMAATYSRVQLTLHGNEGTVIAQGSLARDVNKNLWATETIATIPEAGSISVWAKCTVPGSILALPGSIVEIATPTDGWVCVTNETDALPGNDTETDTQARARCSLAVSRQSSSMITSLYGALSSLEGVEKLCLYENSTAAQDENGLPACSICAVLKGGSNQDIASAIFRKKAPGCGTYGTTSVTVTDVYGRENTVHFLRPTEVAIAVQLSIKALSSYTSDMDAQIKENIVRYINTLSIGNALNVGLLWAAVLSVNQDLSEPSFAPISLTASRSGEASSSAEVTAAYNELLTCAQSGVSIAVS